MAAEPLDWNTLDWETLDRLRGNFFSGRAPAGAYWQSASDLANYDFTYAQRIGWKWDAVLDELVARGWGPPAGGLVDWGCGSGVASRRVLARFGPGAFAFLRLFDHSMLAMDFAADKARRMFPSLPVETGEMSTPGQASGIGTLVVSHVLNELGEAGGRLLRDAIDRAATVLWVEPGTFADSRALIRVREEVLGQFHVVAPCPHASSCGLLAAGNERHWCHHFAEPPAGIMADSNWVRFAQRAGIDLRSLPYSFLVLERKGLRTPPPGLSARDEARVLGRARVYKGFARLLTCGQGSVTECELQKRVSTDWFKRFKDETAPSRWRMVVECHRIVALEPVVGLREKPR